MISQAFLRMTVAVMAALLLASFACAQATGKLYGKQIYLAADASPAAQDSAKALAQWLGKMTGSEFPIINKAGKQGIFLVLDSSPELPPVDPKALKAQVCSEAFLIYSNDADRLWIVGKSDLALDRGVFWYLDKLGCRWLHANERWTVIPSRADITLKLNSLQAPAFIARDFFGTGGFGRPTIDPKQHILDSWIAYKRQNLLGGTFRLGGHTGEAFNVAHKQELLAHPEYIAEIDGKRQEWGLTNKFCISNPAVQELYIKDRLASLKAQLQRDPSTMSVSVEPADGGGHCQCAECKKLGTISDATFCLANLVAKAVAKEFPGKYVNLYAYNEHAAVPSIPLEPNVVVSLAPYAFQRTGMTPEEMIKVWGAKHNFLGLYSYWDIPDWARCLPSLNYQTVTEQIRFWHAQHIKIYSAESTFCGGNMGLNWYLAARLCWDPSQNAKAIVDDYFLNAFGPARTPIRRMYDRWADGFMLTDHELGLCYHDLNEANGLTKDPAILARLADMGRYVHYLRLYYEFINTPGKGSPERAERGKALLDYMWHIYDSNMVQVFRMAQLINRDEAPALNDVGPNAAQWGNITPMTDAEVATLIADGAAKYHPLEIETKRFSDKLVPLQDMPAPAIHSAEAQHLNGLRLAALDVPQGVTRITVKMWSKKDATVAPGFMQMENAAQQTIATKADIPADGNWCEIPVDIPAPGRYYLMTVARNYDVQLPAEVAVMPYIRTQTTFGTSNYTFTVASKSRKEVLLKTTTQLQLPQTDRVTVTDPTGKTVYDQKIPTDKQLHTINIPTATTGTYHMSVFDQKAFCSLLLPTDLPFVTNGGYISLNPSPTTYFYVPKGNKTIAIYSPSTVPIIITDPAGKAVLVERNSQHKCLFSVDVPAGMDGKIWSFAKSSNTASINMLNVPQVFSFTPEAMMVPEEVKGK